MRLARTVDLTGVTAAQTPTLEFALSYDVAPGYDNVVVEAHPVGSDEWTTLPEAGGLAGSTPPAECEAGFLLELHPFLGPHLTGGDPCAATGTTGSWNRISYVIDQSTGGAGVFVDRTRLAIGGTAVEPEGFETGLGPWTVPGAPEGSPANGGDFERAPTAG
jgi:hypothetical protein